MLKVLRVNKQGNKILSYTCTDGTKQGDITKDQLVEHIKRKNVSNARVQVYNGTVIVRITDDADKINIPTPPKQIESKPMAEAVKPVPSNTAPTILDVIAKAKDKGMKSVTLNNITVDTTTLAVSKPKAESETKPIENVSNSVPKLSFQEANKIASENLNLEYTICSFHNRYILARVDRGAALVLLDKDTLGCKKLMSMECFWSKQFVVGNEIVVFNIIREDYSGDEHCEVVIFKVEKDGSVVRKLHKDIEGYSWKTTFNKINDRFYLAADYRLALIVDLEKCKVVSGKRDPMYDVLDSGTSKHEYNLKCNDIVVNDTPQYTDLRVRTIFEHIEYNRVAKYVPMKAGYYLQFRMFSEDRELVTKLYGPDGCVEREEWKALEK